MVAPATPNCTAIPRPAPRVAPATKATFPSSKAESSDISPFKMLHHLATPKVIAAKTKMLWIVLLMAAPCSHILVSFTRRRKRMMLVGDHPAASVLAQPDRQAQTGRVVLFEFRSRRTAEQGRREGDIVTGCHFEGCD